MKLAVSLICLAALFSCSGNKPHHESLRFELRLAQSNPDSTLKEMVFYNSDKKFFIHDSVFLTNSDIVAAEVIDWETQPKVKVILTEEGKEKFAEFTGNHVGENAAILVNDKLISAPRINAQITEGVLLIVGLFNHEEAQSMARGIQPTNRDL